MEWNVSFKTSRFNPGGRGGEKALSTSRTGGCVNPSTFLGPFREEIKLLSLPEIETTIPQTSACSWVTIPTELPGLHAWCMKSWMFLLQKKWKHKFPSLTLQSSHICNPHTYKSHYNANKMRRTSEISRYVAKCQTKVPQPSSTWMMPTARQKTTNTGGLHRAFSKLFRLTSVNQSKLASRSVGHTAFTGGGCTAYVVT